MSCCRATAVQCSAVQCSAVLCCAVLHALVAGTPVAVVRLQYHHFYNILPSLEGRRVPQLLSVTRTAGPRAYGLSIANPHASVTSVPQ